jgi:hypothetical protein
MNSKLDKFKKPIVDLYGKEPETLDELAECVIKVMNQRSDVLGFQWDMWYSKCVSNTHNSPIGKPTNWGCNDDLPRGYPGWAGRVWFRIRDRNSFGSEVLANTLTYTGTGGYGGYHGPWENIGEALYELYLSSVKLRDL